MSKYFCSKCAKEAHLKNGVLEKKCVCDAPVIVNMEATCTGKGSL